VTTPVRAAAVTATAANSTFFIYLSPLETPPRNQAGFDHSRLWVVKPYK
jgi:hypothetical protein